MARSGKRSEREGGTPVTSERGDARAEGGGDAILNKRVTRREVIKGAVVAGAALSLAPLIGACGSGSSTGSSASPAAIGSPRRGGHLRVGMTDFASNDTLDPQMAGTHESNEALNFNSFDRLLAYDPKQNLVNQLADEVSWNSSATQYTVRLRPGLLFHNGKPVTAEDVVFSFNRMTNPKDPKVLASLLTNLERVKKIDNLTVRFYLTKPDAVFTQTLAHYAAVILPIGFIATGKANSLVGTGPFKVDDWTQGQQADFSPFDDYYGGRPYVDKMTWLSFTDPTAQMNALSGSNVDWATNISQALVLSTEKTPGLAVLEAKSGGYAPLCMRVDQKPFTDVRVRQAFRLIVNRPQMIASTLDGYGVLGNDMYSPYDPGYPKDLPQRQQDIEQAKSLLKQAGYDNNLSIDLDTSFGVTAYAVATSTVFAQQAKAAGVTVNVKNLDTSILYGPKWLSWTFSMDVWGTRPYLATASLATLPNGPWNETHWNDPTWTKIVQEAFATLDETKRNELIAQAQKIEYEQGGYIIWSFPDLLDGHSDKVAGAVPDVFLTSACGWRFYNLYFV
jgi:peptide/nickel transport system substrate-binding protein